MQRLKICKPNFTVYIADYLEKYDQIKVMGQGSYGSVSRVSRKSDGKIFAAKTSTDYSTINEIYIYGSFEYGGIASVEEVFIQTTDRGNIFTIILEYGVSVHDYLNSYTNLPDIVKKRVIYGIIDSLSFMQMNGIIYGDIKDANMIIANDTIKLVDFGMIYRQNYGEASYSQSFNSLAGFNLVGLDVYTDESMKERRTDLEYNFLDNAMWALGITIVSILTGDHYYHTNYINQVPKIVYDLEYNPRYVIDHVLLREYPEWRNMLYYLIIPGNDRYRTFDHLKDDPVFKDGQQYPEKFGIFYHNTPPPIINLLGHEKRDVINDMVKIIIRNTDDISKRSLALEYYLRYPIDTRDEYVDEQNHMYQGSRCQALAVIYLTSWIIYTGKYVYYLKRFVQELFGPITETYTKEHLYMYIKGISHYIAVYIGNTCGNLMIDIPYNNKLKELDNMIDYENSRDDIDPETRDDNISDINLQLLDLTTAFDNITDYHSYIEANKAILPTYM